MYSVYYKFVLTIIRVWTIIK